MRIHLFIAASLAGVLTSAQATALPPSSQPSRDRDPQDCTRHRIQFGDEQEVARGEEQVDVPRGQAERISARTRQGGVLVMGWDRDAYRVKACKAAGGDTIEEAQARLRAMTLSVDQGTLSVSEPPDGSWVVHYIVFAPRGGAVHLRATNGPLSLRDFSGTADLETENGPISIARASGHIVANAVNGPVTVNSSSGDITARTQNGPVSVSLADDHWQGEKLEASTHNGPVTIDVPDGYQSGVEVRMGRHSPFHCASTACRDDSARTWDDDGRKVVMGSANLLVKLSTQNGPVTIGSAR
jgi:hypothetical protein